MVKMMVRVSNKHIILADLGAITLAIQDDWDSFDYVIQKAIFDCIEDVNVLIYAKRIENRVNLLKTKE